MSSPELFELIQKNHPEAPKVAFEKYYGSLAAMALRYSKSAAQAEDVFNSCFQACLATLKSLRQPPLDMDDFIEKEFLTQTILYIKNIRSEYFVSSTVHATSDTKPRNYDLFDPQEMIDYRQIENDVLVRGIQQLVPAQRLVFNLHVIEDLSLSETADKLEASEGTVKSNLEKARFNLQKNIDKVLKAV